MLPSLVTTGAQTGSVRVEGITAGVLDEMTDTGKSKALSRLDNEAMCASPSVVPPHAGRVVALLTPANLWAPACCGCGIHIYATYMSHICHIYATQMSSYTCPLGCRLTVRTDRQAECFSLTHIRDEAHAGHEGGSTPSHAPPLRRSMSSAVASGTGNAIARASEVAAHRVVDAARQPLLQVFDEAEDEDCESEVRRSGLAVMINVSIASAELRRTLRESKHAGKVCGFGGLPR